VALTHLVDTSVLTRLRTPAVRVVIERLLAQERVGRARITDLELGFSARNAREWDDIAAATDRFGRVEIDPAVVNRALAVQRALAGAGLRGRKVPDLLIAAAAELAELTLLHYDTDFEHITRLTGQPGEWVVPAGSID
jgi:predicted nucleic acid-binding protein